MVILLPHAASSVREIIAGVAVAGGVAALWRRGQSSLALLSLVPAIFFYLALTIGRFYVSIRFASFLLMPLLLLVSVVLVDVGLFVNSSRVGRPGTRPLVPATVCLALVFSLFALSRFEAFFRGNAPFEDFKGAALLLQRANIAVITNSLRSGGFKYYLPRKLRPVTMTPSALVNAFCTRPGPFAYLEHGLYSPIPFVTCLRERGSVPVALPEVRAWERVWFVFGPPLRRRGRTAIAPVAGGTPPPPSSYAALVFKLAH